ncbi:Inner membrane protein YbaL [Pirellulimonas nuda]|uniref:Inner membrane protein YbaL n=1 Tax=Pirellulimonas nuda TaxID=2528009 RepID=A0A518DED5_9BACT|nr:cation:proton antiporter [Pirellulimonas nuda]QDU89840.1 Inner membrane protein YbaL [Pirellulimonas nuda]
MICGIAAGTEIVDFGVWDSLRDALLLLLAAMVLGTVAERLRQSSIVGYLVAGTLAGPNVLGWISKQEAIHNFAELGVALLLFVIGLEFSPRRLLDLGAAALGVGVLQVVLTTAAGWAGAVACGVGGQEALVIGMMIAMSSTACVLRMLTDRAELDGIHGRAALGVLLVQDVAVVPMMLAVSAMAGGQAMGAMAWKLTLSLLLAVGLIGGFYLVFGLLAPRLLKQRAWRRNRDLPILLAMILALGSAWAAHQLGLSPALGAFAGGVMLAASPFATQVRADVRPLSTLLVTLFFASIGMFGDPWWLVQHLPLVGAILVAIVIGKPLIIALVGRLMGQPLRYSVATGLCLAQIGEFSFVLATIAQTPIDGVALMSVDTFRALISATILSLILTPYFVAAAPRIGAWFAARLGRFGGDSLLSGVAAPDSEEVPIDPDTVMIIGFGPAGQRVAEGILGSKPGPIVVVDMNPDNIAVAERYGLTGFLGDATQSEVLEHAGVHRARVVVLVVPDHKATRQLIDNVRDLAPEAYLIVRCRYHVWHWELLNAGAHEVADEEDEIGRRMAQRVRRVIAGEPPTPE